MKPIPPQKTSPQRAPGAQKSVAKAKPIVARTGVGEVRLIGGLWKRTKLRVPDLPGLRPTPDRVRETLFNWLGHDLHGWRCMDAFAGTGALGLEAASRGAARVIMCEQQPILVAQLQRTQVQLDALAVQVTRGDGLSALAQQPPASLDLVLLDPPFEYARVPELLQAAQRALAHAGFIYLEAPRAWNAEELGGLGLLSYRYLKAGAVHAHLLRRAVA